MRWNISRRIPTLIFAGPWTAAMGLQHYVSHGYFLSTRATHVRSTAPGIHGVEPQHDRGRLDAGGWQFAALCPAAGYFLPFTPPPRSTLPEYMASNPSMIAAGWTPAMAFAALCQQRILRALPHHLVRRGGNIFASNPDLIQGGATRRPRRRSNMSARDTFQHRAVASFDALEYMASNPGLNRRGLHAGVGRCSIMSATDISRIGPPPRSMPRNISRRIPTLIAAGLTPAVGATALCRATGTSSLARPIRSTRREYLASNPEPDPGRLRGRAAGRCSSISAPDISSIAPPASFDVLEYMASNPRPESGVGLHAGVGIAALCQQRIFRALAHHLVRCHGISRVESRPDRRRLHAGVRRCSSMSVTDISSIAPPTSFDAPRICRFPARS